jgi:hypothetical protein
MLATFEAETGEGPITGFRDGVEGLHLGGCDAVAGPSAKASSKAGWGGCDPTIVVTAYPLHVVDRYLSVADGGMDRGVRSVSHDTTTRGVKDLVKECKNLEDVIGVATST